MEAELKALEDKISQLVQLCQRLRAENLQLRQGQAGNIAAPQIRGDCNGRVLREQDGTRLDVGVVEACKIHRALGCFVGRCPEVGRDGGGGSERQHGANGRAGAIRQEKALHEHGVAACTDYAWDNLYDL